MRNDSEFHGMSRLESGLFDEVLQASMRGRSNEDAALGPRDEGGWNGSGGKDYCSEGNCESFAITAEIL